MPVEDPPPRPSETNNEGGDASLQPHLAFTEPVQYETPVQYQFQGHQYPSQQNPGHRYPGQLNLGQQNLGQQNLGQLNLGQLYPGVRSPGHQYPSQGLQSTASMEHMSNMLGTLAVSPVPQPDVRQPDATRYEALNWVMPQFSIPAAPAIYGHRYLPHPWGYRQQSQLPQMMAPSQNQVYGAVIEGAPPHIKQVVGTTATDDLLDDDMETPGRPHDDRTEKELVKGIKAAHHRLHDVVSADSEPEIPHESTPPKAITPSTRDGLYRALQVESSRESSPQVQPRDSNAVAAKRNGPNIKYARPYKKRKAEPSRAASPQVQPQLSKRGVPYVRGPYKKRRVDPSRAASPQADTPRRRGRPRKEDTAGSASAEVSTPRRHGRPKKADVAATVPRPEEMGVRRSTRERKPSYHFDELQERNSTRQSSVATIEDVVRRDTGGKETSISVTDGVTRMQDKSATRQATARTSTPTKTDAAKEPIKPLSPAKLLQVPPEPVVSMPRSTFDLLQLIEYERAMYNNEMELRQAEVKAKNELYSRFNDNVKEENKTVLWNLAVEKRKADTEAAIKEAEARRRWGEEEARKKVEAKRKWKEELEFVFPGEEGRAFSVPRADIPAQDEQGGYLDLQRSRKAMKTVKISDKLVPMPIAMPADASLGEGHLGSKTDDHKDITNIPPGGSQAAQHNMTTSSTPSRCHQAFADLLKASQDNNIPDLPPLGPITLRPSTHTTPRIPPPAAAGPNIKLISKAKPKRNSNRDPWIPRAGNRPRVDASLDINGDCRPLREMRGPWIPGEFGMERLMKLIEVRGAEFNAYDDETEMSGYEGEAENEGEEEEEEEEEERDEEMESEDV